MEAEQIDEAIRDDVRKQPQQLAPEEQLQNDITENGTLLNVAVEAKRLLTESMEEDELNSEEQYAAESTLAELSKVVKNARKTHVNLLCAFMTMVAEARQKRLSNMVEPLRPLGEGGDRREQRVALR